MVTTKYGTRPPLYQGGQRVAILSSDPKFKGKTGYIESIDDRKQPTIYTVIVEGNEEEHTFFQAELGPIEYHSDWGKL